MPTDYDDSELRRYLLGELPDERMVLLERQYFGDNDTLDRVQSAESDLVDDYVSNRLSSHDRERFERHYLATAAHRQRVAIARELSAAARAAKPAVARVESWRWYLIPALAALLLLATASVWMVRSRTAAPVTSISSSGSQSAIPPKTVAPPGAAPAVVALTLSPVSVRGTDQGPILELPPNAGRIVLELEGDVAGPKLGGGRAVVRTVTGGEIWRGAVERVSGSSTSLARIDIPATALPADDYIVVLFETDRTGGDVERYRYFLRVRSR
jgi:hypothetical protein